MASSSDVVEVEEEEGPIATTSIENIPNERQDERIVDTERITDHHYADNTSQSRNNPFMVQSNVAHGGSVQIIGNITDAQLNFYKSSTNQSLFSSLIVEPHQKVAANDTVKRILAKKVQFQAGRRSPQLLEYSNYYAPYAVVRNRKIKGRLFRIAEHFQFLDRGFAEYFQVVVPSYDQDHVRQLLDNVRKDIATRQNRNPDRQNVLESIYLGDLGHFCEEVSRTWSQPTRPNPVFTVTHWRDEILHYLQDALEVPYWEFMVDLFLGWRANSKALSGDIVLRVLDNVKLDVLDGKRHLLDELEELEDKDKEDITPIVKGIDTRIRVLESIWDKITSNLEKDDFVASLFEKSSKSSTVTVEEQLRQLQDGINPPNETVILIALILLFLIGSIIPGYKGFAISMQSSSSGSTGDADFWYLIQSSIMAVLGNIVMVVPLLKKSWFSPAYSLMWTFFMLGLAFSIISIIIYPLINTGWSSMVSFFGSIASATSVLVMTQATSKGVNRDKVKTD